MADRNDSTTTVRYVDPFRDGTTRRRMSDEDRTVLRTVNQKIAARPSLRAIVGYLFDHTQDLIPCDRIGLAFVDEAGQRVTSYYNRANYEPLLVDTGYSEALRGSSLQQVLQSGLPRIIGDLEAYLTEHPRSRSTRLLVKEGVRSSLTCPLSVEGRVVGFMFRSSRDRHTYDTGHIELQMAIAERLSQAVEKAWRIEQLEEANRAYFEMLGFVSHELKSPVASLVTDATLLRDGYLGDLTSEQREKVERMIAKGQHLLGLVREYLDLARVEGGELTPHVRPDVDYASAVVEPSLDIVRPHLEARRMRLASEMPTSPPPRLDCDPDLVRIVLINLLDNAVKYGKEGGEVRLTVEEVPARRGAGRRVRTGVWNEGPGFSPAQRNQLFRRFSRLQDPELSGRKGTGVGLYNAWRIVQLHGGTIRAESRKGAWARFEFDLPQTQDHAAAGEQTRE